MARIDNEIQQIRSAIYGEEVRGSICDALLAMNDETEKITEETYEYAKEQVDAYVEQHQAGLATKAQMDSANAAITGLQEDVTDLDTRVDQIAQQQIPEEYLEQAVDNYVSTHSGGFATKEELTYKASTRYANAISSAMRKIKKVAIPDEIYNDSLYNYYTNDMASISGCKVKKIELTDNILDIYVTTSVTAGSPNFPLVTYFRNGVAIGYEYMNVGGQTTSIDSVKLNIPDNAEYLYVNSRNFNSVIQIDEYKSDVKEISILFIGNSMTQDAVSYVPYILKHDYPEVEFKLYIWYNGGKTLSEQYTIISSKTPAQIFSVAENNQSWINYYQEKSLERVLLDYKFDFVCLQEYFNYMESYDNVISWNNIKEYISNHYSGGNPLKFISLLHAPLRTKIDTVYPLTIDANKYILQNTISEGLLPCGIATYRALHSPIGTLGDGGDLTPGDRTHAQEGIPSLLQAYTVTLWILRQLSISKSIYNSTIRITTDVYNSLNVPGPNLGTGVVIGTDEQNRIAQECAIMADKEGKQIENSVDYMGIT